MCYFDEEFCKWLTMQKIIAKEFGNINTVRLNFVTIKIVEYFLF